MTTPQSAAGRSGRQGKAPALIGAVVLIAVLSAAAFASLTRYPNRPPEVIPATAPPGEFSAERARLHLREIAEQPRPVGSSAHVEARRYLVDALKALGLEPEVQQATGLRRSGDTVRAAAAANIVARLPGTNSTRPVLLVAHYDSVVNAPGATDAGNGVAAILETVRALRSAPPLRNDVIALITDAEEPGLLGAQAFVDEHPWAAETGIVLNAEGRGHTGPVAMFRTTPGNGHMIRTLARVVPGALAESMSNDAFRHMPNDTDLTVFQEAGHAGMDFANAHGFTHYHTALDSYLNADPRSLQHHGDYMLALARGFGNEDLSKLEAPDRVYFGLPLLGLVHYPADWAMPLALVVVGVALAFGLFARQRNPRPGRAVTIGFAHFAAAIVLLPAIAVVSWRTLAGFLPEVDWFSHGTPYGSDRYLLGLCLVSASMYMVSLLWIGQRAGYGALQVAPFSVWACLAMATALWLPGGAYLFLWPLAVVTAAGILLRFEFATHAAVRIAILAVSGSLVVLLLVPVIEAMEVMLTLSEVEVPIVLLVLMLGLLMPQLAVLARGAPLSLSLVLAVSGIWIMAAGAQQAAFTEHRPKPNGINYIADADEGEAWWYSTDPEPDEWTGRWLGPSPERVALPQWAPPWPPKPWARRANVVLTQAPAIEILEDETTGSERQLRLVLRIPDGAHVTVVRLTEDAAFGDLRIDGRPVPGDSRTAPDSPRQIYYYGRRSEGAELRFTLPPGAEPEIYLRSDIPGLPRSQETGVNERPSHMMPAGPRSDLTQLQRRSRL